MGDDDGNTVATIATIPSIARAIPRRTAAPTTAAVIAAVAAIPAVARRISGATAAATTRQAAVWDGGNAGAAIRARNQATNGSAAPLHQRNASRPTGQEHVRGSDATTRTAGSSSVTLAAWRAIRCDRAAAAISAEEKSSQSRCAAT